MKKVLLVIIDAFASRILLPALGDGHLPLFRELITRGVLREQCLSIFPSITPAATASIATGTYPVEHGIAGGFWYNREDDDVAYFGDDFWVVVDEGVGNFFNDFLVQLNRERLQASTIYERVERSGKVAASINFMWFRGDSEYEVNAPLLFKLLPTVSIASNVPGPQVLALADFAASQIPGRDEQLQAGGGLSRRFGFHDDTTAEYLLDLATADPFPEFTLAYFPNNDFVSHAESPAEALKTLEAVDEHLRRFIDTWGGIDRFLEEFAIVISGDHSQSDLVADQNERSINLAELLVSYQLATAGCPWQEGDELMVCPNMRACHIYVRDKSSAERDRVVERLLTEPRIDQVLWRDGAWDNGSPVGEVDPDKDTFHIATAHAGRLRFRQAHDDAEIKARDTYDNGWTWDGDLSCIDARVSPEGVLISNEYPNALERIAHGFCRHADDLWVTARVGHEFEVSETSIHEGGSHGALNKDDSTAPLIAAGVPEGVTVPKIPRTIDLAPLCLQMLGLTTEAERLLTTRHAGRPH